MKAKLTTTLAAQEEALRKVQEAHNVDGNQHPSA
jgi:hypothetical protein